MACETGPPFGLLHVGEEGALEEAGALKGTHPPLKEIRQAEDESQGGGHRASKEGITSARRSVTEWRGPRPC